MIRIIKEGKKIKYTITCPDCGCEFEYDIDDVYTDHTIALTTCPVRFERYVRCPCCGKHLHHDYTFGEPFITWDNGGSIPCSVQEWPDCDKCPNKPDPDKIVIGDSPCTWCKKNQPYCTNYSKDKE